MDVTGWRLLEEAYSGEAEVMDMTKNLVGAMSVHRNIRRTPLSVWTVRASRTDFTVVFWTPVSRIYMDRKADFLAQAIHLVNETGDYAVFSAPAGTGEFFQFEVFPRHK